MRNQVRLLLIGLTVAGAGCGLQDGGKIYPRNVDNHLYLVLDGYNAGGIIHSAGCANTKCQMSDGYLVSYMAVKEGAVVNYGHIYPIELAKGQGERAVERLRSRIAEGSTTFTSNDVIITSISRLP